MLEFDLRLRRGEFELCAAFASRARRIALFGPSGAGKTSLLLAIAGLYRQLEGRIALAGRPLFDSRAGIDLVPEARRLGVVFQDDRLFPHLSVRDNLRYPRRAHAGAGLGFDRAVELLDLGRLLTRRPRTLSGGEARRVAVARALLAQPEALLLDEPLTGLHREARAEVLERLVALQERLGLPTILVSHQVEEVDALADEVVHLHDGRVTGQSHIAAFRAGHRPDATGT